jgi:hypothetical protein
LCLAFSACGRRRVVVPFQVVRPWSYSPCPPPFLSLPFPTCTDTVLYTALLSIGESTGPIDRQFILAARGKASKYLKTNACQVRAVAFAGAVGCAILFWSLVRLGFGGVHCGILEFCIAYPAKPCFTAAVRTHCGRWSPRILAKLCTCHIVVVLTHFFHLVGVHRLERRILFLVAISLKVLLLFLTIQKKYTY